MRQLAGVVVATLALLVGSVALADAAPGVCVVTPNPVDLTTMAPTHEPYTVTAEGANPELVYEVGLFQKGKGINDERALQRVYPDGNGVVTFNLPVIDGTVEGGKYALFEGSIKVEVKAWRSGGKDSPKTQDRLATCYFDVIRS